MSKKYYKQGEKLEHLKQDIKLVLGSTDGKEILFMPKENYYDFSERIKKPIIDLHTTLLRTKIDDNTPQTNTKKVTDACNNVILLLEQNIASDLKNKFFEEKLQLYDKLYIDFIKENLAKYYGEYKYILSTVTKKYSELKVICLHAHKFPEYDPLVDMYMDIQDGLSKEDIGVTFDITSINYIAHSAELLMEKIQELFANEFIEPTKYIYDDRNNRIRRLIYMLKTKLNLDLND